MTHVLGLLTGLSITLGLLIIRLIFTSDQSFITLIQRSENLSLALTLLACITIYAGLVAAISRPGMNEVWLAGVSGAILMSLLALQVTLNIHLAYLPNIKVENEAMVSATMDDTDTPSDSEATPSTIPISQRDHLRTGGPLAAAWSVCFFIYMAYALLPIRLRHACIAGVIFSLAHLIGAFFLYSQDYPAMLAHLLDIQLDLGQ
ncbi:hypothetical protein PV325_006073 [Microctonus aethiopoides]|nr:hypothetical protein PV325_006073 [Microctonus aethiopoides]